MQFKVPLASAVAALMIAGVAGAYAIAGIGANATLESEQTSAAVSASSAGLRAHAAGGTADVDTSGSVPSTSIELPVPPLPGVAGVPASLPSSFQGGGIPSLSGVLRNVPTGDLSIVGTAMSAVGAEKLPALGSVMSTVSPEGVADITHLLSAVPAGDMDIVGQLLNTMPA